MSYTETETVTHALRRSGLLGADETPTADDLEFARTIYQSRLAALSAMGVNFWNLTAASVPDELLDPLAEYLKLFLLSSNGGPSPNDDQITAAERPLRRLGMSGPTYETIGATYY